MNKKHALLIIGLSLILVAFGFAIYTGTNQEQSVATNVPSETGSSGEDIATTTELLTYTNKELGFSFVYPLGWSVVEYGDMCKDNSEFDCIDKFLRVSPEDSNGNNAIVIRVMDKYVRGHEARLSYPVATYDSTPGPINFDALIDDCPEKLGGIKEDNIWSQYICAKVTYNSIDMLEIRDESNSEYVLYYDFYVPDTKLGVTMYSTSGFNSELSTVLNMVVESVKLD